MKKKVHRNKKVHYVAKSALLKSVRLRQQSDFFERLEAKRSPLLNYRETCQLHDLLNDAVNESS